ncbi:hypothetical protein GBA52_006278 [Prunus armeniaca]|nr:hypothetical protein GBA52_006278 [Prunus armeniaca]
MLVSLGFDLITRELTPPPPLFIHKFFYSQKQYDSYNYENSVLHQDQDEGSHTTSFALEVQTSPWGACCPGRLAAVDKL